MNRLLSLVLQAGLVVASIAAVAQAVLMMADVFLPGQLPWYWGGALAYFAAPVAFALTLRLLDGRSTRVTTHAQG